jgi:uncharacterized protein YjbJ (UPF0337 family)
MRLPELDNIFLKAKGKRQKAKGKRQKAKGKRQKAKGKRQKVSGSWPLVLESTDEGCGWIGDMGGGTRQSKGDASTATFTVAVEFRDQAG